MSYYGGGGVVVTTPAPLELPLHDVYSWIIE